ncbi:MAG: hypothetical protein MUC92_09265, partial [Fimbriimonadaceae bacterium]|nr:hypothetical protein [Fimbriimonadaceae bacterium]
GSWVSSEIHMRCGTELASGDNGTPWGVVRAAFDSITASSYFSTVRLEGNGRGSYGMVTQIAHTSESGVSASGKYWNTIFHFDTPNDGTTITPSNGSFLCMGDGVGDPDRLKNNAYFGIAVSPSGTRRNFTSDPSPIIGRGINIARDQIRKGRVTLPLLYGMIPELDVNLRARKRQGLMCIGAEEK